MSQRRLLCMHSMIRSKSYPAYAVIFDRSVSAAAVRKPTVSTKQLGSIQTQTRKMRRLHIRPMAQCHHTLAPNPLSSMPQQASSPRLPSNVHPLLLIPKTCTVLARRRTTISAQHTPPQPSSCTTSGPCSSPETAVVQPNWPTWCLRSTARSIASTPLAQGPMRSATYKWPA